MYDIAAEEISSFNGLGAGGEAWNNYGKDLTNTLVNAATSIANTAITAKNNKQTTGGDSSTYSPTVYVPTTTTGGTTSQNSQSKSIGDYLPWIIGGLAVFGLGYMIMKK